MNISVLMENPVSGFFLWSCMDVRVDYKKAEHRRIDSFEL